MDKIQHLVSTKGLSLRESDRYSPCLSLRTVYLLEPFTDSDEVMHATHNAREEAPNVTTEQRLHLLRSSQHTQRFTQDRVQWFEVIICGA